MSINCEEKARPSRLRSASAHLHPSRAFVPGLKHCFSARCPNPWAPWGALGATARLGDGLVMVLQPGIVEAQVPDAIVSDAQLLHSAALTYREAIELAPEKPLLGRLRREPERALV